MSQTIELDITPPEGALYSEYRVYWRDRAGGEWSSKGSTSSRTIRIADLPSSGEYEFAVVPVTNGIEAGEELWSIVEWAPERVAPDVTPDAVTNFSAQQSGNDVILAWDEPAQEVGWYEVRIGPTSWDLSLYETDVVAPATRCYLGIRTTGSQTYRIAAYSPGGVRGATASATINGEANDYEQTTGTVTEAPTFGGTKTGTEVSSSKLQLTADTALASGWTAIANTYTWPPLLGHRGTGTYVTATVDAGAVVRERIDMNLVVSPTTPTVYADQHRYIVRPTLTAAGEATGTGDRFTSDLNFPSGAPVDGIDVDIEIDTAQDGVPTWDGYRRWCPGAVYTFRQVRLRVTLTASWWRNLQISTMTWKRRRQNRKDEALVTVSGTGGTDVTWTTTFSAAPKVTATVESATAYHATVSDVTASGCKVRIFDAAGAEQASGTVHVHAMGT